jgi:hypothetical protein
MDATQSWRAATGRTLTGTKDMLTETCSHHMNWPAIGVVIDRFGGITYCDTLRLGTVEIEEPNQITGTVALYRGKSDEVLRNCFVVFFSWQCMKGNPIFGTERVPLVLMILPYRAGGGSVRYTFLFFSFSFSFLFFLSDIFMWEALCHVFPVDLLSEAFALCSMLAEKGWMWASSVAFFSRRFKWILLQSGLWLARARDNRITLPISILASSISYRLLASLQNSRERPSKPDAAAGVETLDPR